MTELNSNFELLQTIRQRCSVRPSVIVCQYIVDCFLSAFSELYVSRIL